MFAFDLTPDMPTEFDLALAEEQRLIDAIQHTHRFPRLPAEFSEHATDKLMSVWKTMIDGIEQSTRRITGARMSLPIRFVRELIRDQANPQAVDAMQLIQFLPVVGASVQHGPVAALELLTLLVRAGYCVSGEEVDALTEAFDQTIHQPMSGSAWIAAGCPSMVLLARAGEGA